MQKLHIPNFIGGYCDNRHATQLDPNQSPNIIDFELGNPAAGDFQYLLKARQPIYQYTTDANFINLTFRNINIFKCTTGANSGKKYIITGGFDNPNSRWFYAEVSGFAPYTHTALFNASSNTNGIWWSVLFNQYVYMGDGYISNRKWDGNTLTDLGVAHPKCLEAGTHKNRLLLANDLTNGVPNRLWISNVGSDTIPSTSFIDIGSRDDAIVGVIDGIDRIIVIKQRATYAVYLSANLADSTVVVLDTQKGVPNRQSITPYKTGFISCVYSRGLEVFINEYEPLTSSTHKFRSALMPCIFYYNDYVYVTTPGDPFTKSTPVEHYLYSLSMKTTTYFNTSTLRQLVVYTLDGVNAVSYLLGTWFDTVTLKPSVVVLNDTASGVFKESINLQYVTPKFTFGDASKYKSIEHLSIACFGNSNIKIDAYADGVLRQSITLSPSVDYSVLKYRFNPHQVRGRVIQFIISVPDTIPIPNHELYEAWIHYNIEDAVIGN